MSENGDAIRAQFFSNIFISNIEGKSVLGLVSLNNFPHFFVFM